MSKYLLCRPEGGLNDMFRQIGCCLDYCLRYGRTLVVDTEPTRTFIEPFSRYFSLQCPGLEVRLDAAEFLFFAEERGLSLFPPVARLRYDANWPLFVSEKNNYCLNDERVTFDFTCEYEEDVLVHHQCGGGQPGAAFIAALRLSRELVPRFRERWTGLPKPYLGIHIRNTDRQSTLTDVLPVLLRFRGPVFLATDSAATQREVRALLPGRIFMSEIPDYGGSPLHHHDVTAEEKSEINTTAIVDLLLLALAEKIYLSAGNSGYSVLAKSLNRNQRLVIRWLSGGELGVWFRLQLWFNYLGGRIYRGLRH